MSYVDSVLTNIEAKTQVNVFEKFAEEGNTNADLMTISDLCFYINELNKNNPNFDDGIQKKLAEWKLSDKDIEICSNFHLYSGKYQERLLSYPSIANKMVNYANVLSGRMVFKNDNENHLLVSTSANTEQDVTENKIALDNRDAKHKFYREAWLRKTYNETGLEESEEQKKINKILQYKKNRSR